MGKKSLAAESSLGQQRDKCRAGTLDLGKRQPWGWLEQGTERSWGSTAAGTLEPEAGDPLENIFCAITKRVLGAFPEFSHLPGHLQLAAGL